MEFSKVQHFINEIERNRETIASQQAEIERLREELEGRIKAGNLQQLIIEKWEQGYAELKEKYEGQQQPEPQQESLKVRILRYLNHQRGRVLVRDMRDYSRALDDDLLPLVSSLKADGLIGEIYSSMYEITAAGRDYLASLDKPTIETAEDYLSQIDNQQQEPLEITLLKALAKDGHQNAMSYHDICDCVGGAFASKALDDLRINRYITKAPRSRGEVQRYLITTKGRQHLEDSSKAE